MKTQAYFDNIQEQIITELDSARNSVIIAVAWFTDEKLFETLCRLEANGIKIELLMVNDKIRFPTKNNVTPAGFLLVFDIP